MDNDLAAWGKVVILETVGRHSSQPRRAAVGFVAEPSGSLLVAANAPETHWALNLVAEPDCFVEREGERGRYRADPLDESGRRSAVAALIIKYGTPAERLGGGPAFRLVPRGGSRSTGNMLATPTAPEAPPDGVFGQPLHSVSHAIR